MFSLSEFRTINVRWIAEQALTMPIIERMRRNRELAPFPVIFFEHDRSTASMNQIMGWISSRKAVAIPCDANGTVSSLDLGRIEACRRGAAFAVEVTREARRDLAQRYHLSKLIPIARSRSLVRGLLEIMIGIPTPVPSLTKLSTQLTGIGRCEAGVFELAEWLDQEAWDWLERGRVALAAVIDAAAQLSLPATAGAIALALEYPATIEPILHVAIQRIRWVPVTTALQIRINRELRRRIGVWEKDEQSHSRAAAAMSAMTWTAEADTIPWIQHRLLHAPPQIAKGIAHGLLDWASVGQPSIMVREDLRNTLFQTLLKRWRTVSAGNTTGEIGASLIWAMGALAPLAGLQDVAAAIASAFQNPVGLEDAAAVRAGRLLIRRHGLVAEETLRKKFDETSEGRRYMALLGSSSERA